MKWYPLNKTVLSFKNDAVKFLTGLTSNSMDKPRNAFLDLRGRIIATFDQLPLDGDHAVVVLERPFTEALLAHIDKFARLSRVAVTNEDYRSGFDLEGNFPMERHDLAVPQKKGRLVLTRQEVAGNVAEEEFTLFRLKNHIPIHGIDYRDEMILNVGAEEFVSFTKGCFLGQEPVAKVHNRSQPTWKLVVKYCDECTEEEKLKMTSKVKNPQNNREMGFIFTSNR